jgi:Ca-activated chloride channel family protein
MKPSLACRLKHTAVRAGISGFLSRVNVTQEFENPLGEAIEAVYVFPLPQQAAVDDMTILIGERTVRGKIKRREEARKIYEAARARGQLAGLLDQERPNIFTQPVANIPPGARVKVSISYVERLKFEDGGYEFVFPMVVGPRYIPGHATGRSGGGWAPDTNRVPDASRITPPVARPGTRAGHDISLEVKLDAGVPIEALAAPSHEIDAELLRRDQQRRVKDPRRQVGKLFHRVPFGGRSRTRGQASPRARCRRQSLGRSPRRRSPVRRPPRRGS